MPARFASTPKAPLYDLRWVRDHLESLAERLSVNPSREGAYALLLEHLPIVVWYTDENLKVRFAIGEGMEGFGWERDVEGMSSQTFLDCGADHAIIQAHWRAMEGRSTALEFHKRERCFYVHTAPHRESGRVVGVVAIALDITDRKTASAALERMERMEQDSIAITKALPDLVFHLSREGRFIECHAPDPGALLSPPEHFIGRLLEEIMPPHVAISAREAIAHTLESHAVSTFEYALAIDDISRDFEARVARVDEDEVIVIVREVSPYREALRELQASRRQLSAYHDIVVHDLANYSMSMQSLVSRLLSEGDGPLSTTQRDLLRRAQRQTHEMNRLAGNARILSQHRGALPEGAVQTLDLVACLNNAIQHVRTTHFERALEIELDFIGHTPDVLLLSTTPFLEHVLVNLLDNAVRHGRPPESETPPWVGIQVTLLEEQVHMCFRNPSDLTQEAVAALFDEPNQDTDLGLALVHHVVTSAGGVIQAGIVSTDAAKRLFEFTVTLPRKRPWDES